MQRWKKGLFIGLFSSMLWEQQTVQASIGLAAPATRQPYAPLVTDVLPSKTTGKMLAKRVSDLAKSQSRSQEDSQVGSPTASQSDSQARELVQSRATPLKLVSRGDMLDPPKRPSQSRESPSTTRATRESNSAPTLNPRSGATATQSGKIVSMAMRYQGIPYAYGGTTPDGFDCSGFIQYVYQLCGMSLPRTTYEQAASGVLISRDQLLPGDLVLFACGGQANSHAGIYLGEDRFIHADQSQGIAIADLSSPYWSSAYEFGVRVR